jgi:hypothetical protein
MIVGNMIAPGIGGAIGGALGGAIGGATDQSSASNDAMAAQVQAQQAAAAARAKAAGQVGTLQAPYVQAGYTGLNALTSRLGLPGGPVNAAVSTAQSASPVGDIAAGAPNALAPSAAPFQSASQSPGANALAPALSMAGTEAMGQAGPMNPATTQINPPTLATTPVPVVSPPAPAPNALAPGGAAQMAADPGTFGNTANPVQPGAYTAPAPYVAPAKFNYSLSDYTASPAYQYQQDQARNATLAGASATGALQSGAAMKALQDRAQNIAYTDFANERGFANNLYNTNNANALSAYNTNTVNGLNAYDTNQNVYDNNRNYLTSRFDTQTGNLFKYTGAGQDAANTVGNADLGVGSANAAGLVAAGNAQAGNALQQGQIGSNLAGNVAGIAGSAFTNYLGGSGSPLNLQTAPTSAGIVAPSFNANPTFVNPLPTTSFGF